MGDAARSRDQAVGRRYAQTMGRRDADPLRRSFSRRRCAALGAKENRLLGRYSHRRHRPQVAFVHAQLSEFHSTVGARGRENRRGDGAFRVREDLRPLLRPHHRLGCKTGAGKIRRALCGGGEGGERVLMFFPSFRGARQREPGIQMRMMACVSGFWARSLALASRNDERSYSSSSFSPLPPICLSLANTALTSISPPAFCFSSAAAATSASFFAVVSAAGNSVAPVAVGSGFSLLARETSRSRSICEARPSVTGSIGARLTAFQWLRSRIAEMVDLVVPTSRMIWLSL